MVSVSIDGTEAVFELKGLHKLWALKNEVRVPLAHIRAVRADPNVGRWPAGLRLPGTFVPGLITAGSYRDSGRWTFWDVVDPGRAIVVELTGEHYAELIVEVADPAAAVSLLERARASAA